MIMSGGFPGTDPEYATVKRMFASRTDFVAYLLREGQAAEAGTQFLYSNTSAHLVAAVLAAAIRRADGDHPRSVVNYAREKLFDPLGVDTDPAFVEPLPDTEAADFAVAGFGWGTDPQGIPVGAFGLRLTASDMMKLGELYLNDGAWHGRQIVPAEWVKQVTTPSELQPAIRADVVAVHVEWAPGLRGPRFRRSTNCCCARPEVSHRDRIGEPPGILHG
jgi:CubicO group peptidase (beta-lactamase class C family)